MSSQAAHEARLLCRQCGFDFGTLARDRRHADLTDGVRGVVHLPEGRLDLECPRCLTHRSFVGLAVSVMIVPELRRRGVAGRAGMMGRDN